MDKIFTKEKEENIKDYLDKISSYKSKDYWVDIIYMQKKVALIINSKKNRQKEIAKAFEGLIIE